MPRNPLYVILRDWKGKVSAGLIAPLLTTRVSQDAELVHIAVLFMLRLRSAVLSISVSQYRITC